jgi:putative ABC transport system ATP-binding protein
VSNTLIELDGISKTLGGSLLFRDIHLKVNSGESIAILGESGSGKSTLLHLMAGLDAVDTGNVHWSGTGLNGLSPDQIASKRLSHIGLVFQAYYLMPHLTALQNVELPFLLANQKPLVQHCKNLLESVGLLDKAGRFPRELSGGEQQRVAIARALALQPPLILADEPTGNLDERNAEVVLDILLDICKTQGCALVMVTHSDRVASRLGSRFELHHNALTALVARK